MPPKKRGRGAKAAASRKAALKREIKTENTEDEPPLKLERSGSLNTQLKAAIQEVKSESTEKKRFKLDSTFECLLAANSTKILDDYSCMLNQTNIGHNNNKFYVIQIGVDIKKGKTFTLFTKWGRVGESGMNKMEPFNKKEDATKGFEKKFKDKTKNDWSKRENFQPASGKYTMLEIDEESDDEDEPDGGKSVTTKAASNCGLKCSLDVRTMLLVKLIFNNDMFVSQMVSMNLDVRKMPLGKLSKSQIAKGLEVLIEIEEAIKKKKKGGNLSELSSKFYTLVPHDFGRMVPPVINDEQIVSQKKELMITLSDIELTQSLQKDKTKLIDAVHPLDESYSKLDCELQLLDKKLKEFKMISTYAKACPQTRKGDLLDVWRVDRNGADARFSQSSKLSNRKLLWHGTSVAVVAAILKAGLRIMPHSGGRLGSGIYFASEHSKSAGYVGAHYGVYEGEKNVGFMFLTEVALGKESTNLDGDGSLKKAPPGYDCVVGRGQTEPDPSKNEILKFDNKEVVVPLGKPVNQKEFKTTSHFDQSEYLVYKESQARIRYLLKFSFHPY